MDARAWLSIPVVLASAALACGAPEAGRRGTDEVDPSASVVARVNGEPLYVDPTPYAADLESRETRRKWVENAVVRRLSAEEARRRGLAEHPEVRRRLGAIRRQSEGRAEALLRDSLYIQLRDGVEISEADLKTRYEEIKGRFLQREIQLLRERYPDRAAAEAAEEALGAAGHLDPESSEEIGPLPIDKLPRDLLPEVLELKSPGDRIVAQGDGDWSLLELVQILPAVPKPFEEVRDRVEEGLRTVRGQEAFRQLAKELRAQAQVEIDAEALADDAIWERAAHDAPRLGRIAP